MTINKVRRIDFYPDEYVAGVAAKLSAVDQGVYWMVCALVYSRGGPIDDDHTWLAGLFSHTHWRTVRGSLDRLIDAGKVERVTDVAGRSQITVKRCARELQKAFTRSSEASQNGRKGGRPANKNNSIEEPNACSDEKLTTNQQPPTNNQVSEAKASSPRRAASREPEGFAEWYEAYPKHVERKEAAKAYEKAAKEVPRERLLEAAKRYAERMRGREPEFVKHPSTWLNKGCWDDEEMNGKHAAEALDRGALVERGTPQWDAWLSHFEAEGRPAKWMRHKADGQVRMPSEWPPTEAVA